MTAVAAIHGLGGLALACYGAGVARSAIRWAMGRPDARWDRLVELCGRLATRRAGTLARVELAEPYRELCGRLSIPTHPEHLHVREVGRHLVAVRHATDPATRRSTAYHVLVSRSGMAACLGTRPTLAAAVRLAESLDLTPEE